MHVRCTQIITERVPCRWSSDSEGATLSACPAETLEQQHHQLTLTVPRFIANRLLVYLKWRPKKETCLILLSGEAERTAVFGKVVVTTRIRLDATHIRLQFDRATTT